MPLDLKGRSGFSMPLGGSLYPAPPHHFHGARQAWATYESDGDKVRSMLPPGVEPDSDPPVCQLWVCDYPSTSLVPISKRSLWSGSASMASATGISR
jgi:acetoacetate decarboxylase